MIYLFSTISITSINVINILFQALLLELVIFLLIPAVGAVIESVIVKGIRYGIAILLGGEIEFAFSNYVLFPGTVIHELSHAFFALITGAKIDEVALFKPEDGSLGHVSYRPRGNALIRGLQNGLSACAPVIVGLAICYLYITKLFPLFSAVWHWILGIYILVSMIFHMNMSVPDLKLYFMGSLSLFAVFFPICVVIFAFA